MERHGDEGHTINMKKPEPKKEIADEFYLPPTKEQVLDMYDKYANMKSFYVETKKAGSKHVVPEHLFLHSKKVYTWTDYGWAIYDDGSPDYMQKYLRAKQDWRYFQAYYIKQKIREQKELEFYETNR